MPPIDRHTPSTKDSSGSTVVLALTSPSSSMTWTCSRSRRAFWAGSKFFSQSEMLPPKAATPRRVSASMSPSRYLRSSIILRLPSVRRILPEDLGHDHSPFGPLHLSVGLRLSIESATHRHHWAYSLS